MIDEKRTDALAKRRLPLTLQQYAIRKVVPLSVMNQSTVEAHLDVMLGGMAVALTTSVLADKTFDHSIAVDRWYEEWTSWWQHTKGAFPPLRWLTRKLGRPARRRRVKLTTTFDVRQWVTFPNADLYPVGFGDPVVVEVVDAHASGEPHLGRWEGTGHHPDARFMAQQAKALREAAKAMYLPPTVLASFEPVTDVLTVASALRRRAGRAWLTMPD